MIIPFRRLSAIAVLVFLGVALDAAAEPGLREERHTEGRRDAGGGPSFSTGGAGAAQEGPRVEHREGAGVGRTQVFAPDAEREGSCDRGGRELRRGGINCDRSGRELRRSGRRFESGR